MLKKISIGLLGLVLLLSCGPKQAAEEGNDLTLTTVININDLPVLGPISIQETQMFSENVMRSMISTSINLAGEQQEISSVFLINLDQDKIYFINDLDSNYSVMTFAQFDSMLATATMLADTAAAGLELTKDMVEREDTAAKVIGSYGECVPVKFDLVLSGTGENSQYQSSMTGEMWLSNSIKNGQLFMDFQKKASSKFENAMAGNTAFFGMAGALNLNQEWFKKINQAMTGIPVQAEFKITMPVENETITYGITMNLEDHTTANIEKSLFMVPESYKQVPFSEFKMY
jgi:hypothetical protein